MKSIAATVAASKAVHPENYCRAQGCLWRVQGPRATPCPRHPLPSSPLPGYDVHAMTYHGGSVDAENRVDDRQHIANDREEARELAERWTEDE